MQGDLYCLVEVETPVKMTTKQKKLLRSFTEAIEAGGDRHRPRNQSWHASVRSFFDKIGS
jgi:molecular chaperone DnaJ